jgi:hypothetical protein
MPKSLSTSPLPADPHTFTPDIPLTTHGLICYPCLILSVRPTTGVAMRRLRAGAIGLAVVATSACSARPLMLPAPGSVTQVEVSEWPQRGGEASKRTIDAPETISAILAALSANNKGYDPPLDTFPGPQYGLVFAGEKGNLLVVWIGPDWLGGAELPTSEPGKRLRALPPDERARLLSLIGSHELQK